MRRPLRSFGRWIDITVIAAACAMLSHAVSFASHVSAVVRARYLQHIDTNWIWLTADNLLTDPWSVRLVPYYFIAVVAPAVHGGCGLRWF
jgi:hypothetical protein